MNRYKFLLPLIVISLCNANNDATINAEYCLYMDSTELNGNNLSKSKWQLKITNFIKDMEFPKWKLNKQADCQWAAMHTNLLANNKRIDLQKMLFACFDCSEKESLKYSFYSVYPKKYYNFHNLSDYIFLNSQIGKKIQIEWKIIGFCDDTNIDVKDTIDGKYHIIIKEKCEDRDLEYSKNYDEHKLPTPIDNLNDCDFDECRNLFTLDSSYVKLLSKTDSLLFVISNEIKKMETCSVISIPEEIIFDMDLKKEELSIIYDLTNDLEKKNIAFYPSKLEFIRSDKKNRVCRLTISSAEFTNDRNVILINSTPYRIAERKDGSRVLREVKK